jgi:hypothetical protein
MLKAILLAGSAALTLALPAHAQQVPTPFQQGLADRQGWENWFVGLTGDYRAGAYYWSGQRSLPQPGSCTTLGGDATAGCFAAQGRLASTDARRKSEPDYRLGWNSYSPPPPMPSQPTTTPLPSPASPASNPAPAPLFAIPTPAPMPTVAMPTPAIPGEVNLQSLMTMPVAGHNGAWDIITGQNGGKACIMRTQTTSGATYYSLMMAANGKETLAAILTNAPAAPVHDTLTITDKGTGEILMMKPVERDQQIIGGYQIIGTFLSVQDTIRLWGIGLDDLMGTGSGHWINVKVGTVSFDVDIHGAMQAYENIQSCAGGV